MKNYLRIIITVTVFILLSSVMVYVMSVLDLLKAFEKTVVGTDASYMEELIAEDCALTDDGEFILFIHSNSELADTIVVNKSCVYSDLVRYGLTSEGFMSFSTVYSAKIHNAEMGFTDDISYYLSFELKGGGMKITSIEVSS